MFTEKYYLILWLCIAVSLSACGIDGTGGFDDPEPEPEKVTSIGTITDENKLLVNGVEYDASSAIITIDNARGSIQQLSLGQIVAVVGTLDENQSMGVAELITYNTNVFGPVESIGEEQLTILGQDIKVDDNTVYDGELVSGFDDLALSDSLQVSGFLLASGELLAAYINRVALDSNQQPGEGNNPFYEVNGTVAELDSNAMTFRINNLLVDFSQLDVDLAIENGMTVEVLGAELRSPTTLQAESVSIIDVSFGDEGDLFEIEGFVTAFNSSVDLSVNNIELITNAETIYVGGEASDLELDTRLEVEGYLDATGTLVAERIIFLVATLTSHVDDEVLASDSVTFSWRAVEADQYRIIIVSDGQVSHDQYYPSQTTSAVIDNLPINGARITLILHTLFDDRSFVRFYSFTGQATLANAELTSHSQGAALGSSMVTFSWTDVNADEYQIEISSRQNDFFSQTYGGQTTSTVISNLPINSAPLSFRLRTRHGVNWFTRFYNFTSHDVLMNSVLTSHTNNQGLNSDAVTFQWDAVNADEYEVVLSSHGIFMHRQFHPGDTTEITVDELPINEAELAFTLRTRHGEGWFTRLYSFTSHAVLPNAELISHNDGDSLFGFSETFSWSDVSADEYLVSVFGSGGSIHRQFYTGQTTSVTIGQLPQNGENITLLLRTRHGNGWFSRFYNFVSQND